MASIKQLLADGEAVLVGTDSARLDAELLLAFALEQTRTWLYTWPEHVPALPQQHLYLELLRRRQAGEPIAYLTGSREFWKLQLKIDSRVLIPRPETEVIVETLLAKLADRTSARIADLGTGSGAIALSLAADNPGWELIATDCDDQALALARENAELLDIHNVDFLMGSWTEPLMNQRFAAIVSNPPYIDPEDPHLARGDVRFEPTHALISAEKGFADIRAIISGSPDCLEPEGWLLLEHGFEQGEKVRQLFAENRFTKIETIRDLSGNERVTIGQKQA